MEKWKWMEKKAEIPVGQDGLGLVWIDREFSWIGLGNNIVDYLKTDKISFIKFAEGCFVCTLSISGK